MKTKIEVKYNWVVDEEDKKDLIYVDRDTLLDYEIIDNLFEQLKIVLNDHKNTHTGIICFHLARYVAQKTAEIFDIINTNERIKYAVSKLELKKNND